MLKNHKIYDILLQMRLLATENIYSTKSLSKSRSYFAVSSWLKDGKGMHWKAGGDGLSNRVWAVLQYI